MKRRDSVWVGSESLRRMLDARNWDELRLGPYKDRKGWWGVVRRAATGQREMVSLTDLDIVDFRVSPPKRTGPDGKTEVKSSD